MENLNGIPRDKTVNWALEIIVQVVFDCESLRDFSRSHTLTRKMWERELPPDRRRRFQDMNYVRVTRDTVYLTTEGLAVLNYGEAQV